MNAAQDLHQHVWLANYNKSQTTSCFMKSQRNVDATDVKFNTRSTWYEETGLQWLKCILFNHFTTFIMIRFCHCWPVRAIMIWVTEESCSHQSYSIPEFSIQWSMFFLYEHNNELKSCKFLQTGSCSTEARNKVPGSITTLINHLGLWMLVHKSVDDTAVSERTASEKHWEAVSVLIMWSQLKLYQH